MAIRFRNLDLETAGMKRHQQYFYGDAAAGTTEKSIFAAPVACRVDYVDVFSTKGVSGKKS